MQAVISSTEASRPPAGPAPDDRDEGVLARLWDEAEQVLAAKHAPRETPPLAARLPGVNDSVRFAYD